MGGEGGLCLRPAQACGTSCPRVRSRDWRVSGSKWHQVAISSGRGNSEALPWGEALCPPPIPRLVRHGKNKIYSKRTGEKERRGEKEGGEAGNTRPGQPHAPPRDLVPLAPLHARSEEAGPRFPSQAGLSTPRRPRCTCTSSQASALLPEPSSPATSSPIFGVSSLLPFTQFLIFSLLKNQNRWSPPPSAGAAELALCSRGPWGPCSPFTPHTPPAPCSLTSVVRPVRQETAGRASGPAIDSRHGCGQVSSPFCASVSSPVAWGHGHFHALINRMTQNAGTTNHRRAW